MLYIGGDAYTAPAVYMKQNGGSWQLYYLIRDHQGSIAGILDNSGSRIATYSYDPWGRMRDPSTLVCYNVGSEPALLLNRGYTGHEHLAMFGLINMNGRVYDPCLGRFLNTDNYVQDASNSQNFNRYSYCLNNPLIYKDEDGNFFILDDFIIGFFKGLFTGENPLKSGYRQAENCVKIYGGLFAGNLNQVISRFTWELPQTILGLRFSQILNTIGDVKGVNYYYGATVLKGSSDGLFYGLGGQAMTLGSYIMGNNIIETDPNNSLFQHEYGHYLQSKSVGWAYLSGYALPSLLGDPHYNSDFHDYNPIEQDANVRAIKYFHNKIKDKLDWDFYFNPIGYPGTDWNKVHDYYETPQFQSLLKSLTVHPAWIDYIGWRIGLPGPILAGLYHSLYYSKHFIDHE